MEKLPKEILWLIFENLLMDTSIKLGRKSLYNYTFSIDSVTGKLTKDLMSICKTFRKVIVRNSSCKNGNLRFTIRYYIVTHSIVATMYIGKSSGLDSGILEEWEQFELAHDGKIIRRTNITIRTIKDINRDKLFSFVLDGKEQLDGEKFTIGQRGCLDFYNLLQKLAM